jgi:hypothetical protein
MEAQKKRGRPRKDVVLASEPERPPLVTHQFTVGRVTRKGKTKDIHSVSVQSEQNDWFEVAIRPDDELYKAIAKAVSKGQSLVFDASYRMP